MRAEPPRLREAHVPEIFFTSDGHIGHANLVRGGCVRAARSHPSKNMTRL